MRGTVRTNWRFRPYVSGALVLTGLVLLMASYPTIGLRIEMDSSSTYTTTYTTTFGITFNYLTTISGTTFFAGYVSSTTTTVVATITTSMSNSQSISTPITTVRRSGTTTSNMTTTPATNPSIDGFPPESIIGGMALGVLLLFVVGQLKRRVRNIADGELK